MFSEVGLVVKVEHFDKISGLSIIEQSDRRLDKDGSVLIIWESIKWYRINDDVFELYNKLKEIPASDYLIRESFPEYPSDNSEGNAGEFFDNPFNLSVRIVSELSFEE